MHCWVPKKPFSLVATRCGQRMRRIWNALQLVNMTAGPERLPELTYLFGSIKDCAARFWVNPSTLDKLAAMGNAWT
jgi:hypothetical protein